MAVASLPTRDLKVGDKLVFRGKADHDTVHGIFDFDKGLWELVQALDLEMGSFRFNAFA
jgi:hypothetical protein